MIRVKNNKKNSCLMSLDKFKPKKSVIVVVSAMLMSGAATTANATIDNSATATGSYGGIGYDSNQSTVAVPVAAPNRSLAISSIGSPSVTKNVGNNNFTDVGDTITIRYKVTNNSNITESVSITANNPTFKLLGGTPTQGTGSTPITKTEVTVQDVTTGVANNLAPGEVAVFDITYTMTDADAYRAAGVTDGISFVATANAATITNVTDATPTDATAVTASIDAYEKIELTKLAYLGELTQIPVGATAITSSTPGVAKDEYVTYEYTVTNAGNVPLSGVSVTDVHEGSTLASGTIKHEAIKTAGVLSDSVLGTNPTTNNDGTIDTLGGKAVATFLYQHKVTQDEIDGL